jgi:hypothetical protein
MPRFNLERIDLHVPQYGTGAVITIDENHSSGVPHLRTTWCRFDGGMTKAENRAAAKA